MKIILAGTHTEAARYAREHGWHPREWRDGLVPSSYVGFGCDPEDIVRTGTFGRRPDADELYERARLRIRPPAGEATS